MLVELVTKEDLQRVENRLDQLINAVQAAESNSKGIYTTEELAKKLKVSTKTIQNWRNQRLIEYQRINRKIYFQEDKVKTFLDSYTIKRSIQTNNFKSVKSN